MKSKLHHIVERIEYTRRYETRYVAEIKHLGLGKFRVLKDADSSILKSKLTSQFKTWDDLWEKQENKRLKETNRVNNNNVAIEKSLEAQNAFKELEDILTHALVFDIIINFSDLKDHTTYPESNPKMFLNDAIKNIPCPVKKPYIDKPDEPEQLNFKPQLNIFDRIFPKGKKKKIEIAKNYFECAFNDWEKKCEQIELQNQQIDKDFHEETENYNSELKKVISKYDWLEKIWIKNKEDFYEKQKQNNLKIDDLEQKYLSKNEQAVLYYCELVLNNSVYPEYFPKDFQLDYNTDSGIIIVEFVLPSLELIPTLKEVRYITTKDELKESHITELQKAKIYDDVIYKITLRTIYELFESDKIDALNSIIFNGWVESINKATGKLVNNCIVSIKVDKSEFENIDLSQVDPKICFKNLKGIGSSKLSNLISIQPIIQIDKSDKRFVGSYDVASEAEGQNLATMFWEDFEHLIRELFEKEFSINGGEVKITQASRDGGVDAVAFDPDPIRGGKIVIQAKRYTNTVGVSAVRDLYGTVINEGATKGILVTTADYGSDAYTFSKDKPLTLLNGSNLLYLLEKHGHKSRIDIKEAKQILKEKM